MKKDIQLNSTAKLDPTRVTAIILAGGEGRRWGGRDKGLIEWQGKPFIEHICEQIAPQVDEIIISCNRNLEQYRALGYRCIEDQAEFHHQYQGPLAGLLSCWQAVDSEYILLLACDNPQLPAELSTQLYRALQQQQAALCYGCDRQRDHYLLALLKNELQDSLIQYMASGQRRVGAWYNSIDCCRADIVQPLLNINNPEALAALTGQ